MAVWAFTSDRDGWGIFGLCMAIFSYLSAPVETPPRFGLEHDLSIDSEEFLTSVAGATGAPFIHSNRIDILNNGDEFSR